VFSTITDRLLLHVQKLEVASQIWSKICNIHEDKMELVQIDLRCQLQETRCEENGDVRTHFSEMLQLHESLAGMGAAIEERDFNAMILASLPESYHPLLSSINAMAKITATPLSPYKLINIITKEYEHQQLTDNCLTKKGGNSALSARVASGKGKASTSLQSNPDTVCYNCDRKGHYKMDCWRPGGGKEGQGLRQQHKCGRHTQKQAANTAKESEEQENYAFMMSDLAGIAKMLNVPADCQGASAHFCPDRLNFKNFIDITPQEVYTVNSSVLSAARRRDVGVVATDNVPLTMIS
jgi:hypothetical protein